MVEFTPTKPKTGIDFTPTSNIQFTPTVTTEPNALLDKAERAVQLSEDYQIPISAVVHGFDELVADPQMIEKPPQRKYHGTKYKSFWDELQKATAVGELQVGGGMTGTLAHAMDKYIGRNEFFRHVVPQLDNSLGITDKSRIATKDLKRVADKLYAMAGHEEFTPADRGGIKGFVAKSVGQALPFMTASLLSTIATGTPMAAFGVSYAIEGEGAYRDAINRGLSEEEARMEGVIVGTINGVVETFQVGEVLKTAGLSQAAIKQVIKSAKQKALRKVASSSKDLSLAMLKNSINEGIQESIQETVSVVTPTLHGAKIDFPSAIKQIGEAGLGAAVVGPGASTVGGIKGAVKSDVAAPKGEVKYDSSIPGFNTAIDQLLASAKKAKAKSPKIRKEQREELSKRVGKRYGIYKQLRKEGIGAEDAINRSKGALKGELAEYNQVYEPIREELGEVTVDSLMTKIGDDEGLQIFEKDDVKDSLNKLIDGSAMTMREAYLLERYFGGEIGELVKSRIPLGDRMFHNIAEITNIQRTILSSYDQSGILRQALPLGVANPKEYGRMILDYKKAFWSHDSATKLESQYKADPYFAEAKKVGLEMPEWGTNAAIEDRAERFMASGILEGIPGIAESERSFVTALNSLRMTVYSKVVSKLEVNGFDQTVDQKKELAAVINALSGRTKVGGNKNDFQKSLAKWRPILNATLFSPGFTSSRFAPIWQIPKAVKGSIQDRRLRPEMSMQIKSAVGLMSLNAALLMAAKMAFDDDDTDVSMELDLRSTDGGKIKIDDQKIDFTGGYLPAARLLYRMGKGERISQAGEVVDADLDDLLLDFLRTKQNPFVSLIADYWTGEDFLGTPFGAPPKGMVREWLDDNNVPEWLQGAGRELLSRTAPLVAQDVADALVNEGYESGTRAFMLGFHGAGVSTYPLSGFAQAKIMKNEIAQKAHNKKWDELAPSQQMKLRQKNEHIALAEQEARAGKARPKNIDLTAINESADYIGKKIDRHIYDEVKKTGVGIGVSRRLSNGFELNKERYKEYQDTVAEVINKRLKKATRMASYQRHPNRKEKLMSQWIRDAKDEARLRIIRDIEKEKD